MKRYLQQFSGPKEKDAKSLKGPGKGTWNPGSMELGAFIVRSDRHRRLKIFVPLQYWHDPEPDCGEGSGQSVG